MRDQKVKTAPPLKGLVLAGGDSARMGHDKGLINYHGLAQQDYLYKLLIPFTAEVFISRRKNQLEEDNPRVLEDIYNDLGPFGGILSAFTYDPNCAWLVVACDFPLLDSDALLQLTEARDESSYATSFLDEGALMPEPWITILEPKIYPVLLDYFQKGRSSLRGILVDYNTSVVRAQDQQILLNANTPEESERIKRLINSPS